MPIFWFIRRLQKILLRLLPVSEDVSVFLVQESALVLSTQMSVLGGGGRGVFDILIE